MSDFDFGFERRDDGVAVLTLDRPDSLNSLTFEIYGQLEKLFVDLETDPNVKVVFLTMHSDVDFATEAFRVGASGFLLKHSAAEELHTAINEALQGRVYITPLIAKGVLASLMENPEATRAARVALTPRQREVLQLVAEGRTIKEIAAILDVSPRTVEFHKTNLVRILCLKTTAELTQYAVRKGMVSP